MAKYTKFMPAPRGLDYNNFLVQGVPEYALELEGLIPRRRGLETIYDKVATTLGGNGGACTGAFVSNGQNIFICTASGPAGIYPLGSNVIGYALPGGAGTCSAVDFSTGAGSFTIFCNGADTPGILTVGGAWAASTFTGTGLTISNLFQGVVYRGRLYFAEKNTQNFWYGSPNAINGALTKYSLGGLLRKGGKIVAMTTLSSDSGVGPDDLLAVYTSSGECVVFSGNDPGVSAWQVVGVYDIGPPPCTATSPQPGIIAKMGGDSVVLTARGIFSLTELIKARAPLSVLPLSDKITPMLSYWMTFALGQGNRIWVSATQKLLILTINSKSQTYAMDLETGGWFTMSQNYGNAVAWLEASSGSVVNLYQIVSSAAYRAFAIDNSGTATGAASKTLSRLKTQYGRFGLADQFFNSHFHPYIYIGSGQVATTTNALSITAGVAFDLRGAYNERSIGSNNASVMAWEQISTTPSLSGDFGLQSSTFGRILRPRYTVPSDTGSYMSATLSFLPSSGQGIDVVKIQGIDVVIEAMPTSTI